MKNKITFRNGSLKMSGEIYRPAAFSEKSTYPAIVLIHPAGGVKEQVVGLYATKLSEYGFVALTFDATHQGESEGEPRYLDNPFNRVEDARCAVDYLTTLSYVDEERIGVFGICAGGGYALSVAQTEHRFKSVATVSAVDMGSGFRDFFERGTPISVVIGTLEAVGKQRTAEAKGAAPVYGNYVPMTKEEINAETPVMLKEAHEYYRTSRGHHPRSVNKFLFSGADRFIAFSAFDQIPTLLTQPMLLIAGSIADTKVYSDKAYKLATCEKELFVVDGATHVDLYDIPKYVNQAIPKLAAFYSKTLAEKINVISKQF
jgi:fermentation-respiration switch protein FrsA (DUF1100 family)